MPRSLLLRSGNRRTPTNWTPGLVVVRFASRSHLGEGRGEGLACQGLE